MFFLYLVYTARREVFKGRLPMDVIFIDTGFHLKEVYEFRDKIAKEWNLNLITARNEEVLKLIIHNLACPFQQALKKEGCKA